MSYIRPYCQQSIIKGTGVVSGPIPPGKRAVPLFDTSPGKRLPSLFLAANRLVGEVRREPAFDLFDGTAFAAGVTGHLIVADSPDCEVSRLRMREVQAADARRRQHRRMLGQ